MTILADKKAAAAAQAAPVKPMSLLARARAQSPRGELVEMPLVGRVWVELVGEAAVDEIEGMTMATMKAEGLEPIALNAMSYDSCRTALTLAHAVRNPENREEHVGSAEEWRTVDIDVILACGLVYNDVRERLSPVALGALTKEQRHPPRDRKKKRDAVAVTRRRCAVALSAFYGRPACDLTDDQVLDWAIPVDEIPSVSESESERSRRSADLRVAPPPGVMRFVNSAHDPTGGKGRAA